jgi:hypothetical protein
MATTKINGKKLAEAIQTIVKTTLLESNHFSAMRSIEHMAASTSMEFEKNIVDALGLMNPDHMQPDLQAKYFQVVSNMKEGIKSAVMDAAKQLISFPREEQQIKK